MGLSPHSAIADHARMVIRVAPWFCILAFAAAALTFVWVRAPLNYLLWSVGVGLCWFALVALAWRTRSQFIHWFTFLLLIVGHMVLRERTMMRGQFLGSLQGMFLSFALFSAPMMLFRSWLLKFARLEASDQGS